MKVLLFKRAEYISEILRFGYRGPNYFESPSDLFLAGAFLRREGFNVDVVNKFPEDQDVNLQTYDVVMCWLPLFDGLYVGLDDIKKAKNAGAKTVMVLNDAYEGTERELVDQYPFIDYAVRLEERELELRHLLQKIEERGDQFQPGDGIIYRDPSGVIDTGLRQPEPTLEHLCSFAAILEKENLSRYTEFFIRTGRGCPYQCTYCHERKKKNRKRRIEDVISESKLLPRGAQVHFGDPLLFGDMHYVYDLAKRIIDSDIEIQWHGEARVDQISSSIDFDLLRNSGCYKIDLGIESLDENILSATKKGVNLEQIFKAIDLCLKNQITPYLNMMVGHPLDSNESLRNTLNGIIKLPLEASIGVQRLRPIGEALNELVALGIITRPITVHEYAQIRSSEGYSTKYLTSEEVTKWHKRLNHVISARATKFQLEKRGESCIIYILKKIFSRSGFSTTLKMVTRSKDYLRTLLR